MKKATLKQIGYCVINEYMCKDLTDAKGIGKSLLLDKGECIKGGWKRIGLSQSYSIYSKDLKKRFLLELINI